MRFIISGQLFSILLHDIKNQLHLIVFSYELNKQKPDTKQKKTTLQPVDVVVDNTVDIINSFLSYIKMDANEISDEPVEEILNEVMSYVQRSALRNQITIHSIRDKNNKKLLIKCSRYRLMSAFLNVVTNAIQHLKTINKSEKEITIHLETTSKFGKVIISDNGEGMSEEVKNKIFSKFSDKKDGTGIGLYFTYDYIVHELGGTIEAVSNEGSSFVFSIPGHFKK